MDYKFCVYGVSKEKKYQMRCRYFLLFYFDNNAHSDEMKILGNMLCSGVAWLENIDDFLNPPIPGPRNASPGAAAVSKILQNLTLNLTKPNRRRSSSSPLIYKMDR